MPFSAPGQPSVLLSTGALLLRVRPTPDPLPVPEVWWAFTLLTGELTRGCVPSAREVFLNLQPGPTVPSAALPKHIMLTQFLLPVTVFMYVFLTFPRSHKMFLKVRLMSHISAFTPYPPCIPEYNSLKLHVYSAEPKGIY